MVETCVAPSKLHLKKELSALQKARCLRDPETCSSWRSPLSSKTLASYNLCYKNDIGGALTRENISSELLEIPPTSEKPVKKVYLYNWKNHYAICNESEIMLSQEKNHPSIGSSLEDSVSSSHREEIANGRNLLPTASNCNIRDAGIGDPSRKYGRRLKKTAISNKRTAKDLAYSKPLGAINSVELSDSAENHNIEVAPISGLDLLCKSEHCSPSTSSLFSGSGCANWPRPSKIFRSTRRDESPNSCTPASTSSYYRRAGRKLSTAGSLGGTTASYEGDEFDHLDIPVRQGCGLPCYWSKRAKYRSCRLCYSPSLCNIKGKMVGSIFCGSHKTSNAKLSNGLGKPKHLHKSLQGMPLLTNGCDDTSSDELSTNFGELDLEALSRLDGRRWSSSKSQEAFEATGTGVIAQDNDNNKSLSVKYKPRTFDEIIGQSIVVQSLINAVLMGKIAPAYLFHGPHGTGKTSVARIFSAALNCLAEGNKPCFLCKACTASYCENEFIVREISATNKAGIDEVRFLRFLEEPIASVVFIFITTDLENIPPAILSHCQKYLFTKIKDTDVVRRLRKLSAAENLEVEMDALNLIAVNSDGSLQDAETMLYQASLFGKKITISLVNDLAGYVSDEKLLDLIECALSSNVEETVQMSRELIDSGVDPIVLVSQLAGLMIDIIAGTNQLDHSQCENVILGERILTKEELKRLQQALKILSEAEKQLKQSSDHSSIFTAALLQLASSQNMGTAQLSTIGKRYNNKLKDSLEISSSGCIRSHSLLATREPSSAIVLRKMSKKSIPKDCQQSLIIPKSGDPISNDLPVISSSNKANLDCSANGNTYCLSEIWRSCIGRCYSKTLRQLLSSHGKLISVTENEGSLIAFIAFTDSSIKARAERYLSSITNSLELVLKHNVEVTMVLLPDNWKSLQTPLDSLIIQHLDKFGFLDNQRKIVPDGFNGLPNKHGKNSDLPKKDAFVGARHNNSKKNCSLLPQDDGLSHNSCLVSVEEINRSFGTKGGTGISVLKTHSQISSEQKLENAWLQSAEKAASGLPRMSNTETNPAVLQNSRGNQLYCEPNDWPSCNLEYEPDLETKTTKENDTPCIHNVECPEDKDCCTISPSILHSNSFETKFDKPNSEYESGSGCNGLLCWKYNRLHRRQVKERIHISSHKARHMFGKLVKSKTGGSKSRQ